MCRSETQPPANSIRTIFTAMPKTEVILIQNVVGLGAESDHVKVSPGYARNYLIPHGLAIPLTAANKRRIEVLKDRRAQRETHELNTMAELGRSLSKLTLLLKVKTGEDGKMFGGITAGMIADELKNQFDAVVDRKRIHIDHPIRILGDHEVDLRLHAQVNTHLKVRVESTTPLPPKPEEPAKAAPTKGAPTREGKPEAPVRGGPVKSGPARAGRTEAPARPAKVPRATRPEGPAKTAPAAKGEKSKGK